MPYRFSCSRVLISTFSLALVVGRPLGRETENQVDRVSRRLPAARPEPRQGAANSIDGLADRLGADLDEVDVLRVSERFAKRSLLMAVPPRNARRSAR